MLVLINQNQGQESPIGQRNSVYCKPS